jgi:phosphatidylserine/phosphatidylglycerophosphate/cardiolipin synthase-like enzyme
MVADEHTVVLGSANWSSGGFERNHELDIELPDSPVTARDMLTAMTADWAAAESGAPRAIGATGPDDPAAN